MVKSVFLSATAKPTHADKVREYLRRLAGSECLAGYRCQGGKGTSARVYEGKSRQAQCATELLARLAALKASSLPPLRKLYAALSTASTAVCDTCLTKTTAHSEQELLVSEELNQALRTACTTSGVATDVILDVASYAWDVCEHCGALLTCIFELMCRQALPSDDSQCAILVRVSGRYSRSDIYHDAPDAERVLVSVDTRQSKSIEEIEAWTPWSRKVQQWTHDAVSHAAAVTDPRSAVLGSPTSSSTVEVPHRDAGTKRMR